MKERNLLQIANLLILFVALACAGSLAGTPPPDTISTIIVATMAAITPATNAPASSTMPIPTTALLPPTVPPAAPTLAALAASRITFEPDATMAIVTGAAEAGQAISYVLEAAQGQIMMVNVDTPNHDVTVSIKTKGGTSMLNPAARQSTWQQALPQTEDYYLTVHGGASPEKYTLSIVIPSRIKFAEGADSVKVSGKTAGGYNVAYALFATKGQKMSVDLSSISGEAALTIYGYNDGTPYVRSASEQTSFRFDLPATQDYIIEVVPKAGGVASYVLSVKVD